MRAWIERAAALGSAILLAAWPACAPAQILKPQPGGPVEAFGFRLPEYNPDGSLKSEMFGETVVQEGPFITIRNLRVEVYEEGKLSTTFWGESCRYDSKGGRLMSDSPVRVIRAGLIITGDGLDWKKGETTVTVRRNVRVTSVHSMGWLKVEKKRK